MLCGDDVIFHTAGWDERVREAFRSVPDRIVMVYANAVSDPRPVLPFVSREWIEAAGFVPDDLQGWFADEWIWSMAADVGRAIRLPDVVIEHQQLGDDATYARGQETRKEMGGLSSMRREFYSVDMVERRDRLTGKLRAAMGTQVLPMVDHPNDWVIKSQHLTAEAHKHATRMRSGTLVVVHCYQGDSDLVKRHMPLFKHHGAPVLVLSPQDSPVKIRGVECVSAGGRGYYGQVSLDRQRAHLQLLLRQPYDYFLLNDADSFCISPTIPRYLYEDSSDVVWSNEVGEWRPHRSPYPKIGMHPPYFLRRDTIAKLLSVADRPEVRAHPITPFIDWYMLALTCEAGLQHKSYPDGASFPGWGFDYIPDTLQLGHDVQHENLKNGQVRGDLMLRDRVRRGTVMVHSVKHKDVMRMLVKEHAAYVRRGSPTPNTISIAEMERLRREHSPTVREIGQSGMMIGETIRI